jgi:hypothetical protein
MNRFWVIHAFVELIKEVYTQAYKNVVLINFVSLPLLIFNQE